MKEMRFIKNDNYNIWLNSNQPDKIIIYLYSEGKHKDADEVTDFANSIKVSGENVAVVSIRYYGTSLKYDPEAVGKLESKIPVFLLSIKKHLSKVNQEYLAHGDFQKVIDDLYFSEYFDYIVNEETVIPFFGNNEYNDFGYLAALSVITQLNKLKITYPSWPWSKLVSVGEYYGAYLAEMIEKIKPNTFSQMISKNIILYPHKDDLFTNFTEWQYGKQRRYIRKMFGKLVLPLVDEFGWTSNMEHEYAFKPRHFDVRNIMNPQYLRREINNKNTFRIFAVDDETKRVGEDTEKYFVTLHELGYNIQVFNGNSTLFEMYQKSSGDKVKSYGQPYDESYVVTSEGCFLFTNLNSDVESEFLNWEELENNIKYRHLVEESKDITVDEKYSQMVVG